MWGGQEYCYVAMDYDEEVRKYDDGSLPGVTYYMPDGQDIKLKETLCRVPEVTPHLIMGVSTDPAP